MLLFFRGRPEELKRSVMDLVFLTDGMSIVQVCEFAVKLAQCGL